MCICYYKNGMLFVSNVAVILQVIMLLTIEQQQLAPGMIFDVLQGLAIILILSQIVTISLTLQGRVNASIRRCRLEQSPWFNILPAQHNCRELESTILEYMRREGILKRHLSTESGGTRETLQVHACNVASPTVVNTAIESYYVCLVCIPCASSVSVSLQVSPLKGVEVHKKEVLRINALREFHPTCSAWESACASALASAAHRGLPT